MQKLISWSSREFSNLPWRKERSLYRTLVSEIMLQQTTVSTVKNHFERFLGTFPTLQSLASASEEELIVAWKGLGYYRRARNLKKIAEALVYEHGGEFPDDLEALQDIPGIGPYTANAVLAIGMEHRALAVDANLERVIARLFGIKVEKGPKLQRAILELFLKKEIFDEKNFSYRALNEALMDLGRTYCQARKAVCDLCFLKNRCVAFNSGSPLFLPIEKRAIRSKVDCELHLLRCYVIREGRLLVYRKEDHEWLAGQYEVPTFVLSSSDSNLKQYPLFEGKIAPMVSFKTAITRYKIKNLVFETEEKFIKKQGFKRKLEWRKIEDERSNFSTATMKGLKFALACNYSGP